jgi:hypothetical protein
MDTMVGGLHDAEVVVEKFNSKNLLFWFHFWSAIEKVSWHIKGDEKNSEKEVLLY